MQSLPPSTAFFLYRRISAACPAIENSKKCIQPQREGTDQNGIYSSGRSRKAKGKRKASLAAANHLRHRHPGFWTAVYNGGISGPGSSHNLSEGKKPRHPPSRKASQDTAGIFASKPNHFGSCVYNAHRQSPRSITYLENDESPLPECRSTERKGIST